MPNKIRLLVKQLCSASLLSHPFSFWLSHLGLPFICALLLAFVYPLTQLDMALIAPYYSVETHSFPLRKVWFTTTFMHSALKRVVILIALLTFIGLLCSFFRSDFKPYRRRLSWILTGLALSPSIISVMKYHSNLSCPWNLIAFGGSSPPLEPFSTGSFSSLLVNATAGHCFPAGHASSGFCLFAFYFGLRDRWPSAANLTLMIALFLGLSMGWAQMARGAHFMSHNLWTALIIWMTLLILYVIWPPGARFETNYVLSANTALGQKVLLKKQLT